MRMCVQDRLAFWFWIIFLGIFLGFLALITYITNC